MDIGSTLSFGGYTWRVLDIKDHAALIITDRIIDQRPYHNAYKEITWQDCSLREYLNTEFHEKFTSAEQSKIIPVLNKNLDNHWYGSKGGKDTEDRIFLLSLEEAACQYFGDSSAKLYNPGKNQRYWFQRKDENNNNRIAWVEGEDRRSWWWLRSPGRVSVKAVYIHGNGNIGIQGNNILQGNLDEGRCKGGVRPAMWIKL